LFASVVEGFLNRREWRTVVGCGRGRLRRLRLLRKRWYLKLRRKNGKTENENGK
jgi:hypothetical protein